MEPETQKPVQQQMCMIRVMVSGITDEDAFALKKKLNDVVGDIEAKVEFSLTNVPARQPTGI